MDRENVTYADDMRNCTYFKTRGVLGYSTGFMKLHVLQNKRSSRLQYRVYEIARTSK
jgi:hypothetical protein